MNAAQLIEITAAEREAAERAAKPRTERFWQQRGIYKVTVGGYIVGQVEKVSGGGRPASWYATTDEGVELRLPYRTRTEAVAALGRTDGAVQAYRTAAAEGVFGFTAQREEQERIEALEEALEAEYQAQQAQDAAYADPEREGGEAGSDGVVDEFEVKMGDRVIQPGTDKGRGTVRETKCSFGIELAYVEWDSRGPYGEWIAIRHLVVQPRSEVLG